MTARVVPSARLLAPRISSPEERTWSSYLRSRIVLDWRPGEFDADRLLFIPNADDPFTRLRRCRRAGCGVHLDRAELCAICWRVWKKVQARDSAADYDAWLTTPRHRFEPDWPVDCAVPGCARSHSANELCASHAATYRANQKRHGPDYTVGAWLRERAPTPLSARPKCPSPDCWRDRAFDNGLCVIHARRFRQWLTRQDLAGGAEVVATWLAREPEPLMVLETRQTYGSVTATPFPLLPEPLRWEFLFAVQQRDLHNPAKLAPVEIRSTYLSMRRLGWTTAVATMENARGNFRDNPGLRGLLREWGRLIDDAHRAWSGVDDRDPKIIYLRDLPIPPEGKWGTSTRMNLTGIGQQWLIDTLTAWARSGRRTAHALERAASAWTTVDEVLRQRGTPPRELGMADMDAVLRGVQRHWDNAKTQERALFHIDRVIEWARTEEALSQTWDHIPAAFRIDKARHRPKGIASRSAANVDEPFRFIPQPVVDWVMDHLHLLDRGDAYLTAEARAMIFVHERCGRRPGETVTLADDCISYDNQGAPYLEWRRCKPPYTMGKRLPIHQETYDVIRQWQQIKRERGIESRWLFPSLSRRRHDKPSWDAAVNRRIRDLLDLVVTRAPLTGPVEGPDGNLIHFDLNSIDAYAFRHAFAQRLADATDADGRSTTPPDVLQDYMGHRNFNTTMAYYEVTAKRRKKALASLAPRRLNLHGEVVTVDRERDDFTKIAVSLGHCSEPQNVAAGGHGCMIDHACESCPFFLVDPLERDGMEAKRHTLMTKLERARVINTPQHLLDHYEARIKDTTKIVDGIDAYVDALPDDERARMRDALDRMSDIRRRATAARHIDLRTLLAEPGDDHDRV